MKKIITICLLVFTVPCFSELNLKPNDPVRAFIKNMKFIDTKETFMKHILFSAIALQKNYIRYLCRILGNKFLSQDELERLTHIFNFKPVPYDFVLPTDGMADSGY